ncbi:MAG: hypothetical protein WA672_20470 [Candidatus Angelobacter sp.]
MTIGTSSSGYFAGGLTRPGSLTHPPVVPLGISQIQPLLQCTVALHAKIFRIPCILKRGFLQQPGVAGNGYTLGQRPIRSALSFRPRDYTTITITPRPRW